MTVAPTIDHIPRPINGRKPTYVRPNTAETTPTTEQDTPTTGKRTASQTRLWAIVSVALGAVILAPIALSSQDLYHWGRDATHGLGLSAGWAWLVPVSLDLAAAACIGMTIMATWRRERAGIFGLLVWVFAATSAYAQFTHGQALFDAGKAKSAYWAMPAFALLGPLLLEVTLHRVRRWARQDTEEILTGAAGFGVRWLVAPGSTLAAWAASRREGIASAREALQFIADRQAVRELSPVEALHYAFGALGVIEPHAARVWLAARGVRVDQAAIDAATERRIVAPPAAVGPVRPVSAPPMLTSGPADQPAADPHIERLAACATKREAIKYGYAVIRAYDVPGVVRWLAERGVDVSRSEAHAVRKAAMDGSTGEYPQVA